MKKAIAKILSLILFAVIVSPSGAYAAEPELKDPVAKKAYGYFLEISKIPRGSGNEKAVSDYLVSFAKENKMEVVQDDNFNVLIKKPGSEGRESEPPIILQAHMDMVCSKNEGVDHDFLKDPIIPIVDGDWIKADGTTLGADDGGGLSLLMAVLASDNLSHPPIEAVITTEEETTMGGAFSFDVSLLKGKRFINLDSEDEGIFTVSSASTNDVTLTVPVEYRGAPKGYVTYKLMIKGLAGGHSGVDIDKGMANANILAARILNDLGDKAVRLASIKGGTQRNAIPREAECVVLFAKSDLSKIQSAIGQIEDELKAEFPHDEDLKIILEKSSAAKNVMSADSQRKVVAGIQLAPGGVYSMSQDIEGLVQTSSNLGVVETDGNAVALKSMLRSSMISEEDFVLEKYNLLSGFIGLKCEISKGSPPWEYSDVSPLRDTMSDVFKEFYGKEPSIEAIHAGLECSAFASRMPDTDFISIGMDVFGAHSPDERMSISSYDRTCAYVVKVLEKI